MNMIGRFATSLVAVAAFSAIIFASTSADSMKPARSATLAVAGEKLDGGLGDLPPNYTGAEFQRAENRDAGQDQFNLALNSKETPQEKLQDLQYN